MPEGYMLLRNGTHEDYCALCNTLSELIEDELVTQKDFDKLKQMELTLESFARPYEEASQEFIQDIPSEERDEIQHSYRKLISDICLRAKTPALCAFYVDLYGKAFFDGMQARAEQEIKGTCEVLR